MNPPPLSPSAAVNYLVHSWGLPRERAPELERLLQAQKEGGTTVRLEGHSRLVVADWGVAAGSPDAGVMRPLVLDPDPATGATYLQSWRYFAAERQIARRLRALAGGPSPGAGGAATAAPAGELGLNQEQQAAVQCGLARRLTLITGGPGTGKTHTLARLLALLVATQPDRRWVVKLAAPTGKAADRMRAAIHSAVSSLPAAFGPEVRDRLAQCAADAGTLHRLLGYNPATGRCGANAASPLRADLVIVDECSMVDTLLWQALLAALGDGTRLILLGDPNQLESVAAGDVLGSIVRHVRTAPGPDPLRAAWTELREARRFDPASALARLAGRIVLPGATDEVLALLRANRCIDSASTESKVGGVLWLPELGRAPRWGQLPAPVRAAIEAVAWEADPDRALAALDRVRILASNREGPWGVAGFNRLVEQHLRAVAPAGQRPNVPIIINRNDAETGLKNGSVGIVLACGSAEASDQRYAWFPADEAGRKARSFLDGRLPADRGPAWAMTIHRSQGSEFDQVLVVLPPNAESPLASRELLYTAVTRTKRGAYVWGGEPVIRAALEAREGRSTRLGARLREAEPAA